MLKALYYPHTRIHNPIIIKNALLLWDQVETIVPSRQWRHLPISNREWREQSATSKLMDEAAELVVAAHVPSQAEKQTAHNALKTLVESGVIGQLIANSPSEWLLRTYDIFPRKFSSTTWNMLERSGLARWMLGEEYRVHSALGLLMMSLIADACAGTQIQKITDRVEAYNCLSKTYANALGSQQILGLDASQIAPAYDRLISITLGVIDARAIPLKKLIQMRHREIKRGGSDYAALRRNYAAKIHKCVETIGAEAKSAADIREIERKFKIEVEADFSDLKEELALGAGKTLFSHEVMLTVIAGAGALAIPSMASGLGVAGIIPLAKAIVDLRGARRTALLKHISSWLFLTKGLRANAW